MNQEFFENLPTFKSNRLIIRPLSLSDSEHFLDLRSNEIVNRYIRREPLKDNSAAKETLQKLITGISEKKWFYWAIQLHSNPMLIGTILLWNINDDNSEAELGYELHPTFFKQGIMTEAASTIIDFAFNTLNFKKLLAVIQPQNLDSIQVVKKQQFEFSHLLQENGDFLFLKYSDSDTKKTFI